VLLIRRPLHSALFQDGQSGTDGTPSDLEFIIPHSSGGGSGTSAYASHLTHDNSLDIQQMTNAAGIVQLRQYQDVRFNYFALPIFLIVILKRIIFCVQGKPTEIQVAHTLASIPSSITAAELQRVGLKLEDLQNQALLAGRPIKLEDLGVSVQGNSDSPGNVTQVSVKIRVSILHLI